ncbi:MAG: ImmA/IrrE family metallo-endopeptidase [Coprothermobacterota bacterium]|nr:ImmA/IrrE family metallo-endopeptidase [Coprothermobacterota bacterium]
MNTEELKEEFKKRKIHLIFTNLEGDGALFKKNGIWYCFINSCAPTVRQRWTMAHELGHFDLHRELLLKRASFQESSLLDEEILEEKNEGSLSPEDMLERQANSYAAELLMPKEEILSSLPELYEPDQILSEVERLTEKFEVSFQALVRRLLELRALRKDLGEWLLSGRAQAGIPFSQTPDRGSSSHSGMPEHHPAPVISPEEEYPLNQEFRYPGDPPHWIRLRQPHPEGAKLFAQGVEVAGISFDSARENALLFSYGKERSLELKRDPLNPYDPNAIEVIGHWKDSQGKERSCLLGYIPKELASRLAKEVPSSELFATLETLILPRGKKSCGIRFSIWTHSSL